MYIMLKWLGFTHRFSLLEESLIAKLFQFLEIAPKSSSIDQR